MMVHCDKFQVILLNLECQLPQKADITLLYSHPSFIRFSIIQLFCDPHTLCGNYIDALYNKAFR